MKSQHPPPCVRFDLSLNWRENKRISRGNKTFLNWTDVCRRYDKDLLLWHEGYSAPILITWFFTKRFTHLRVFSIDLPLLALCQYRLCNILDHTISIFGIKTCIRRMSHIMFSASCQPLTALRSFDPSCITTNFGGGCLLKRNSSLELIPSKPYPFSRTKIVENLHYGDQDDVPLVLKPLLYQPNILYSILISK